MSKRKMLLCSLISIGAITPLFLGTFIIYKNKKEDSKNLFKESITQNKSKIFQLINSTFSENKNFSTSQNNLNNNIVKTQKSAALNFINNVIENNLDPIQQLKLLIQSKGLSFDEILIKGKQEIKNSNKIPNSNLKTMSSYSNELKTFRDLGNELYNTSLKIGAFAAAAAAIAAGYWATSFFSFGATIASATAATVQAALLIAEASIYRHQYEKLTLDRNYFELKNVKILDWKYGRLKNLTDFANMGFF